MSVSVCTQDQLDAAVAHSDRDIIILSSEGVWLHVSGSVTVRAYNSATVEAYGSATVRAFESVTVTAFESVTVEASPHVAVHLRSARARVSGGVIIDLTALDLTDPRTWCDHHGVPVTDEIATVHKAVNDAWTTGRGTDYSPGSMPACDDWDDSHECGGGLHFSPHPWQAADYYPHAAHYVAVGVALDDLHPILGGTPKCKAPRAVVACREVDITGRVLA